MSPTQITGEELKTFFDVGVSDWSLLRWIIPNGRRISGATTVAIAVSSVATCELETFEEGFLRQHVSEGDPIRPEILIASILPPENLVSLEFALTRIYQGGPWDSGLVMSAVTLCEHADEIDNRHLLHCLDLGGSIAAWGARGLYAKTFRDGIDRFTRSELFSTERSGWERFLQANG